MSRAAKHGCLAVSVLALICGCATSSSGPDAFHGGSPHDAVELEQTPFFPQTENQCGPAALATVLSQSGVEIGIDELQSAVYIPDRKGSLQLELVAAVRGHARIPYRINSDFASLIEELHAGRPVLVLQNLGLKWAPIWHYAVVVGYLPQSRHVVLRSGDIERHVMSEVRFARSWERANYWGMVVLRADELPVAADEDRYLRAVAALESIGQHETALQSYETALQRWPGNALALLGLGNTHYALKDLDEAERAYRRLLSVDPGHPIALNNLAETLAHRGCVREATATIDAAIEASETAGPLIGSLVATRNQISAMPETSCAGD